MDSDYLLKHIREKIYDNCLTVQSLAYDLNLSPSYLREFVNINFNTSPQILIETVRLEAAIKLICKNNACLYSIRSSIGYSNPKTFRQAFKRRLKISPSELKEKINKSQVENEKIIIRELWDSLNHSSDFYR